MRKLLVILAACALVVSFSAPSFAEMKGAAASIYGNARFDTFVTKSSSQLTGAGLFDDKELTWDMNRGSARMGIRFKSGDVTGQIEIRPHVTSYVRHWWGGWNFGAGTLIIGQTYDPIFYAATCNFSGRQSGTYFSGMGNLGGCSRNEQIGFIFGALRFAFQEPTPAYITNTSAALGFETDATLPKISGHYRFKFDPFYLNLFAGYQRYKIANVNTDHEIDVDSHVYGLHFGYIAGPFSAGLLLWYAQNPNEYGLAGYDGTSVTGALNTYAAAYVAASNMVLDSEIKAWSARVKYQINDMFAIAGGYMGLSSEMDAMPATGATSPENDASAYYVNLPIQLAKNVELVPEIGKIDEKDQLTAAGTRIEDGDQEYYGAWWFIGW
jgi:hypothetical protein